MGFGTDLQVAQPLFTLVLHWMVRLRATRLLAIIEIHTCPATAYIREEES